MISNTNLERAKDLEGKILTGIFQIEEYIASGSWGDVYKAYDRELEREVAVKVLNPKESYKLKERRWKIDVLAKKEGAIARSSSFIINSQYYFDEKAGIHFIVMPLYDRFLNHVLNSKGGRLSLEDTLKVVSDVISGIKDYHKIYGRAYLDLKPDNIAYDSELDRFLIADKGIVTVEVEDKNISSPGSRFVKSPLQFFRLGKLEDDYFSIANLMYKLVTGKFLFEEELQGKDKENNEAFMKKFVEFKGIDLFGNPIIKFTKAYEKVIDQKLKHKRIPRAFKNFLRKAFLYEFTDMNTLLQEFEKSKVNYSLKEKVKHYMESFGKGVLSSAIFSGLIIGSWFLKKIHENYHKSIQEPSYQIAMINAQDTDIYFKVDSTDLRETSLDLKLGDHKYDLEIAYLKQRSRGSILDILTLAWVEAAHETGFKLYDDDFNIRFRQVYGKDNKILSCNKLRVMLDYYIQEYYKDGIVDLKKVVEDTYSSKPFELLNREEKLFLNLVLERMVNSLPKDKILMR